MTIRSFQTPSSLIAGAANDFAVEANSLLGQKAKIRVLLTGGTLGIEFVAAISKFDLDWTRIWLMFSDERYVPFDHADRNENQGCQVWPELSKHLVRFPDHNLPLDEARVSAEQNLLNELGSIELQEAVFDLCILGMGPDAHIASLFPGHNQPGNWVIAEENSPKPPSERLSLSYNALNRSEKVWFLASGESKLWAVKQALDADSGLPASRVRGLSETVWYLDQEITDAL